jgi:hypothetical protein
VKKSSPVLFAVAVSGLLAVEAFAQPAAVRVDAGMYYAPGRYESDCRRGNTTAGTIFGTLTGGVLGSVARHRNAVAVVSGAVLGGVLGDTIAGEIDCKDQPYAFRSYSVALNGQIGRIYRWRHGDSLRPLHTDAAIPSRLSGLPDFRGGHLSSGRDVVATARPAGLAMATGILIDASACQRERARD